MDLIVIFSWINFVSLNISMVLFSYLGFLSIMPITRLEKRGKRAWKECKILRDISSIFGILMVVNTIMWLWAPIAQLSWQIHPNPFIPITIAIIIGIPCTIIMIIATKDAGKEMMAPQPETKMHKGIYDHIRHPGALGELPLYVCVAIFINSLFLLFWMSTFVIIYLPIMIHLEEKDLIKRFGDEYREYRKRTGALIPKFKKKN